jgi:hypothetical protein
LEDISKNREWEVVYLLRCPSGRLELRKFGTLGKYMTLEKYMNISLFL